MGDGKRWGSSYFVRCIVGKGVTSSMNPCSSLRWERSCEEFHLRCRGTRRVRVSVWHDRGQVSQYCLLCVLLSQEMFERVSCTYAIVGKPGDQTRRSLESRWNRSVPRSLVETDVIRITGRPGHGRENELAWPRIGTGRGKMLIKVK